MILDIFAQHAKSREGKAQVELAQLEYLLPRLRGWGESMSRQAGGRVAGGAGIGSRGPGETKIELDRRRIRNRMAKLRREIKGMGTARDEKRSLRHARAVPSVSIAGYTNAGKSSLLNRLTGAGVLVENALFATLDPTVRRAADARGAAVHAGRHRRVRPLAAAPARRGVPLDAGGGGGVRPRPARRRRVAPRPRGAARRRARRPRGRDDAQDVPELVAINKADVADPEVLQRLLRREKNSIAVSARTGEGDRGAAGPRRRRCCRCPTSRWTWCVPYDRGELVNRVHTTGQVLSEEHTGEGTRMRVRVRPRLAAELEQYRAACTA